MLWSAVYLHLVIREPVIVANLLPHLHNNGQKREGSSTESIKSWTNIPGLIYNEGDGLKQHMRYPGTGNWSSEKQKSF